MREGTWIGFRQNPDKKNMQQKLVWNATNGVDVVTEDIFRRSDFL